MRKQTTRVRVFLLLALLTPFLTFAQTVISGHVLSSTDHSPVPSVTVSIKGTRTGVATGIDGGFTIKAREGDILLFSGIGVVGQEITVGAEHSITVNISTDARNLSEVVVTATGIKKESKRLGYAIQTVDASALT